MVLEFAYLESLGYFKTPIQNFILMDLLALKVTGHDVKRRIANQFSFVLLQQNSPFTSCPVTLRANKSIKMKFFKNKIYCKVS
jgi:hypothetical protein